jgi:peptidoglycan/LPS O-acetylase OafA/YrhL
VTTTAPAPPIQRPATAPHLPYLGGIDGLRAISVVAVILYHAPAAFMPGGFFGVEVFFVISGYLITSLLIGEQRRDGRISLRDFWVRRARRLLPALYALLTVVVLGSAVFASDALARLRGDVPAAFFYVSNWWQIIDHQSYFELAGRPPLLQHLWSLAVEEQFYVLWPLVFAFVVTRVKKRTLLAGTVAVSVAAALVMAAAYSPQGGDSTALYYNTFIRMSGLMAGCALAMVWRPDRLRARKNHPAVGAAMDVLGVLGLVVLVGMFCLIGDSEAFVFRGGFALVDLATLAVLMAVVHPDGRIGRVLGVKALRWVGLRSYGLYLWHFPIFAMTRPQLDLDWPAVPLTLLRVVLTLAATELSYRFVELPIRHGAIRRWRERPVFAHNGRRRRRVQMVGLSLVPLAVLGVLVFDRSESGAAKVQREIAAASRAAEDAPLLTVATKAPTTTGPTTTAAPTTIGQTTSTVATTAPPTTVPPPAQIVPGLANVADPPPTVPPNPALGPTPVAVSAIGDSVMQGAANVLRKNVPGIAVNAERSRQFGTAIEVMSAMAAYNTLGHVVLVHLGTNGTITDRMIDKVMEIAGPNRQVYFVTPKVPRSWEAEDVAKLSAAPGRFPNAYVIDWHNASKDNPGLFVSDGTHLTAAGILAYVQLILNSFN